MMEYGTKIWFASRGSLVQSEPNASFGALALISTRFARCHVVLACPNAVFITNVPSIPSALSLVACSIKQLLRRDATIFQPSTPSHT